MLRISREPTASACDPVLLRLDGQIRDRWVEELRRECEACLDAAGRERRVVLDLGAVSFLDARGIALVRELAARTVVLRNCSLFVAEQLKEVTDAHR
jgi:anti-anti-sigma regulatory factor